MASPQSMDRLTVTPSTGGLRPLSLTPGSRVLDTSSLTHSSSIRTSLSNESIWRRLKEAGFDEESIKRRDKAALIAYIAKLEAEIYDVQHNMGLLILERREWAAKFEEVKSASEAAEITHKREQAVLSSALAEASKHEDNLRKALGIEKECVKNIEKALHEMRAERAEDKFAAESKMDEARRMIEDAQKKYLEAEAKLHAVESSQAEVHRYNRAAERKLQEVESREDDLRRRMISFKSDCDAKEKEILLERQSLIERQRILNESQDRLIDGQAMLNQREAEILSKSQELHRVEKELEGLKENINAERRALMDEKSKLELNMSYLSEREKAAIEKEAMLNRKEQELLISLEKNSTKEHDRVKSLMAEQESVLKAKKAEFESEVAMNYKLVEEEIQVKRRAWELKELDLKQWEDLLFERKLELDVQCRAMEDKGKDVAERISSLEEKEKSLTKAKEDIELKRLLLQREQEEINRTKLDLQKTLHTLEEKQKQISNAEKNLEVMKTETSELLVLETKLKEEIDLIRAQKQELEADSEKLKHEKAKFESEWELIDEKREELRREQERLAHERSVISKFLKDERDSLNMEKAAMRDQYKRDCDSLSHDRQAFLSDIQRERSDLISRIEQERSDILLDIEVRKSELEDCVSKRREEIESYLREKERAFEEEKTKELQKINSLKETVMREQEHVMLEMKRLEAERLQINLDHEQRDREWAELNTLIEQLMIQRQKLKEQRELLHADREGIHSQIEHLEKLENLKIPSDKIMVPDIQQCSPVINGDVSAKIYLQQHQGAPEAQSNHGVIHVTNKEGSDSASPLSSSAFSRLYQRCTSLFKNSSDGLPSRHEERPPLSNFDVERPSFVETSYLEKEDEIRLEQEEELVEHGKAANNDILGWPRTTTVSGETKVIHEVPLEYNDKELNDVGTEIRVDASENSMRTSSKIPARRKRMVEKSLAPVGDGGGAEGVPSYKKRRQENDTYGDATPSCVEVNQSNDVEHRLGAVCPSDLPPNLAGTGTSDNEPEVNLVHNAEIGLKEDALRDGESSEPDTRDKNGAAKHTMVCQVFVKEITTCTEEEAANVSEQGNIGLVEPKLDKPEKGNERQKRRATLRQRS